MLNCCMRPPLSEGTRDLMESVITPKSLNQHLAHVHQRSERVHHPHLHNHPPPPPPGTNLRGTAARTELSGVLTSAPQQEVYWGNSLWRWLWFVHAGTVVCRCTTFSTELSAESSRQLMPAASLPPNKHSSACISQVTFFFFQPT